MAYLSDIEIAQATEMKNILEIAKTAHVDEKYVEQYGKYKAKISDELIEKTKNNPDGKLILVTAINPTPAGEGKTTTSVGLGEAFGKLGKNAMLALREPSLGPCFGIKGGAAGGGYRDGHDARCLASRRRDHGVGGRLSSAVGKADIPDRRRVPRGD